MLLVQVKQSQGNTPVTITNADKITVTDANHPFHLKTFTLIRIIQTKDGPACIVHLTEDATRIIAVESTSLAVKPKSSFGIAIDEPSLQNLIRSYQRILVQIEGKIDAPQTDHTKEDLATVEYRTKRTSEQKAHSNLPTALKQREGKKG